MIKLSRLEDLLKKNKSSFICTDEALDLDGESLYQRSLRCRAYLQENGVTVNSRVIVISRHCTDFIINLFAVLGLGGVVIPLTHNTPSDIIEEIIDLTLPGCICISGGRTDVSFSCRTIQIDYEDYRHKPLLEPVSGLSEDSIALVMMSSGTTGRRKGIALTHRAIYSNIQGIVEYMRPAPTDRFLTLKNFTHVSVLVGEILTCIYSGSHLFAPDPYCSMAKTLQNIKHYAPTFLFANPQLLKRLKDYTKKTGSDIRVRTIYTSGAVLSGTEAQELSAVFASSKIWNVYGLTETGPRVTAQTDFNDAKYGSVGRPIKDTILYIKNPNTQEQCSSYEVGLICVKSQSLMSGYVYSKFQIQYINQNDFFETGDLGYLDDDGDLFILGRANDTINVSGNKVDPVLVEEKIRRLEGVEDCIVFGVSDQVYGSRIVCLLAGRIQDVKEHILIQHCNSTLFPHERPKEFIVSMSIPVNEHQKRSRYWTAKLYQEGALQYRRLPF
ncbi:class I adenylate-forming enzyme family protein [Paenibacillus camerounensis]|uniref:class I adenylate-forming enzyme family protein n=1 Tax=Paenibacillus camerounensis TaxID=1243663 RepID=UPI0005AB52BC|nr:class I adenylate-forming enzyme family protein [Paenibacillus camerounensis]